MAVTHLAAMRFSRHLYDASGVFVRESNGRVLEKLMRTFTIQMETLRRFRREILGSAHPHTLKKNHWRKILESRATESRPATAGSKQK
jgi:hypothetical protein